VFAAIEEAGKSGDASGPVTLPSSISRQSLAVAIGFLAAYVMLDWATFVHPMQGLNITPWNPEAGLAVALLLWRPRAWWLALAAIAAGEALVRPDVSSWMVSVAESAALTAGYAATAAVLARGPGRADIAPSGRQLVLFLAAVAGGALLASALHVGVLAAAQALPPERLLAAVHRGWIGDMAGMLVTLPMLHVLARAAGRGRCIAMLRSYDWWLVAFLAAAATWLVFMRPAQEQFKLFYLLFMPAVWASVRFGLVGAVGSAALVQVLLMAAVRTATDQPLTVFELQVLMCVLCATGLLLGAVVDEREETEKRLRATLRQAAAGDMAAALAHELNQPLAAMATYAQATQLMAQRLRENDESQAAPFVDVSRKLVDEAARAGDVVRRLRDFFREQATQLSLAELRPVLDDSLRSQSSRAKALAVGLEWSCDETIPPLWLDTVQVAIVLRNLVSNGIDAAASSAQHGGRSVHVRAHAAHAEVVVSVVDSGTGLAAHDEELVFDRRRSDKPGGMGVGLAISRQIVQAHGGRMWAEAGPGGRFFFSLPLS
jgi:two-component system, LuxR family, sensor kinase FixL